MLLLTGIVSVQIGAGIAARLFGEVSPAALTGLRLWAAAALLAAVGWRGLAASVRGLIRHRAWRDITVVTAFGVILAVMNFSIYQSFARIPLGIAVTIEFLGPLGLAVAASRRALDLLWVTLAGGGVVLLARTGSTAGPAAQHGRGVVIAGVAFGLVAAAAWAAYILLSTATGRRFGGSSGLVIAMVIAAVLATPAGLIGGGAGALHPAVLAAGVAIGLLSSVIPYSLELEALRRMPAKVFGIWMSLEPAVAALVGVVMLSQHLAAREWAAIGCVMIACAGAMRGSAPDELADPANPSAHDRRDQVQNGHGPPTMGSVPADPATRDHSRDHPPQPVLRRVTAPLTHPTARSMRRIALAGVFANAGIIMTGAAVRLSKSGLGCPDWPACTRSSLVAAATRGDPMVHTWIEFGNRTLTGALMVVAVAVLIAAWRFRPGGHRRMDLVWLAAAQPAGVLLQAVLGGIVVLTKLNPTWVSVHFLVSIAAVAVAVALYVRCMEGTGPPRPLVRIDQRLLIWGLVAVVVVMLAAGTVVTGTGPLAGAGSVPRYHLPLGGVTQAHADIGWALGMLTAVLALSLQLTGAPRQAARLGWVLVLLVGAQGAIGYTQYFTGLPAGLVWVHVSDSVLIWIAALRLLYATRDRGAVREPPPDQPAHAGQPEPSGTAAAASSAGR
jgi:inner membrane transporter RhtA